MTPTDPYAWRAHLADDWVRAGHRLYLHRRRGDTIDVIVGYDDLGNPIVDQRDPTAASDFGGLFLPDDAAQAIADAVKPGPSRAEVARLEDALAVERGRVDQILDRYTGGQP